MKKTILVTVSLFTALLTQGLHAQSLLYTTGFDGTDASQPADWSVTASGLDFEIVSNEYRADNGTNTGLGYYTGNDAFSNAASTWTDYTVTSDIRQTGNAIGGIVARVQNVNSFYNARINGSGAGSVFELYRVGGTGTLLLDSDNAINYTAGQSWTIELSLSGSSLVANLYNASSTIVSTLTATDTAFSSGSAGVRGDPNNNVIVWESFEVSSIPEPSTSGLLLGFTMLAYIYMQRRHTKHN